MMLAQPTPAPWWASILDHAIQTTLIVVIPAALSFLATMRGVRKVNEKQLELRLESKGEHEENKQEFGKAASKLDSLAETAAVVVTQQAVVAHQLTTAIKENTALTAKGAEAASAAFEVANNVNEKFIRQAQATAELRAEGQQQEQARQDDKAASAQDSQTEK